MELLKKYSAMFLPIGIAIVAVILVVATILMGGALKKQMATSITQSKTLQGILGSVVSEKQAQVEKDFQDAHQKDADAFASLAAKSSQRELLAYNMFPAPDANETSNTIFHNFAKVYSKSIDGLLVRMKAGQQYSAVEMAAATRSAAQSSMTNEAQKLTDVLCKRKAQAMAIYADPYTFAGYDYGSGLTLTSRDKALAECWYWQVAYWIQEDVADTIIATNQGASNVLDAPVKRLLGISFAVADASTLLRAGRTAGTGMSMSGGAYEGSFGSFALNVELPKYVNATTGALAVPPLTARISNDDIDVVHFSFAVVMRSSSLVPFVKQLCSEKTHVFKGFDGKAAPQQHLRNQITILGSTVSPVELAVDEAMYYRYGDDALYKVNLVCEYIFNKSGYDTIKPAVVKNPPVATGTSM
jgi:hypothetical protein